jgi:hypothetical protein
MRYTSWTPNRILCNGVKREGIKASPDQASGLFCYVPLHKIRYGIHQLSMSRVSLFLLTAHLYTTFGMPSNFEQVT